MSAERVHPAESTPLSRGVMTPIEEIVAGVWARELALPEVGLDDDLIDLGANSLQGAAILGELETIFGLMMPTRLLFEEPTIAEMAAWIERGREVATSGIAPVRIQAGGALPPVFAVPGGRGNDHQIFRLGQLARATDPDRPFYGFADDPPIPPDTSLADQVAATARLHLAGMRTVQPRGPYRLLGVCIGGLYAWEMARQLEAAGESVRLFLVDTRNLRAQEKASFRGQMRDAISRDELRAHRRARREWQTRQAAAGLPSHPPELEEGGKQRVNVARAYLPQPITAGVTLVVNEFWHRVDPTLGWAELLDEEPRVIVVSGHHGPEWNLPEIAAALQEWLQENE